MPQLSSTVLEHQLDRLLSARTPGDVEQVLITVESEISWIPVGNNPDNYGPISTGADPFDGIAERITNAIDALIEAEVELKPELKACSTPRQAVHRIYSIQDGNLRWASDEEIGHLAANISITFLDSGIAKSPTIEIRDRGIGQHPSEFGNTLLSLNRGYKVSKFYLIGAFGQGGQTTFANSTYCLIVSRKHPRLLKANQLDSVGWTVVRYHDPSNATEFYKQGRWEYCVTRATQVVPTAPPTAVRFAFEHGTLVRLVGYDLPRGSSDVLQSVSTAWSFLNQALFDSILPIRLTEGRTKYEARSQAISGLARRLWRGGRGERTKVAISDSYEIDLGISGNVRINYWAISPTSELERWADVRRGFVSAGQAVFLTLNGQRQGVEGPTFLRDRVNLTYAHDYLIVQVDCDNLSKAAKKSLFASTRDRLREGDFRDSLFEEISLHLRQDRNVLAFERERKARILAARSERDTSRVRELVGRYIAQNPELRELITKRANAESLEPKQNQSAHTFDEIREEEILPVQLLDIPTYLRITNSKDPIPIEKGGNALVRLETDASDGYLGPGFESRFKAVHKRNLMFKRSSSALRNGKLSYFVHCPETIRVGTSELLQFSLERPGASPLTVERHVECVHPFERNPETSESKLPDPRIVPISREGNPTIWAQFSWTGDSVGRIVFGKSIETGIYVSLDNKHLRRIISHKPLDSDLVKNIEERYIAGVAFYLLLKKIQELKGKGNHPGTSETDLDDSAELDRLAHTVATLAVPLDSG
jgi:hypothetical protein